MIAIYVNKIYISKAKLINLILIQIKIQTQTKKLNYINENA